MHYMTCVCGTRGGPACTRHVPLFWPLCSLSERLSSSYGFQQPPTMTMMTNSFGHHHIINRWGNEVSSPTISRWREGEERGAPIGRELRRAEQRRRQVLYYRVLRTATGARPPLPWQ